jgi:hypothetical protein
MASPLVLDTNILLECGRGNKPVAKSLIRFLVRGEMVYIAKAAFEELVTRNTQGAQYKKILADLGISVAPAGSMASRVDAYDRNVTMPPPPRGTPGGPIDGMRDKDDATQPGDIFVVAQAQALNARLWTLDDKVIKRAPQFGVTLVPECALALQPGPNDAVTARRLLMGYKALAALADFRDRLKNQLDLYSGEHKALSDLTNNSFAGFWANRLFNKADLPLLMIWDSADLRIAAADRALKKEDVATAAKELIKARSDYLAALKKYMTWKNGIESAGTQAQVAIGLTAATLVVAAVAAYAAAPAAAVATGDTAAAATQTVARISSVIAKADYVIVTAEAASLEAEMIAEAEFDLAMQELTMMPPL